MNNKISKDYYFRMRNTGCSPVQIRSEWDKLKRSIESGTLEESLANVVMAVVIMAVVASRITLDGKVKLSKLWVTSPSRKTTVALPFYTALRVVNNRGWYLAKVEPIKPKQRISRLQAFGRSIIRG